MAFELRKALRSGVRQFVDHPQLWLTVIVAVSIFFSYLYLADRFITIAQDAQDRLINVRVGALQDAFVPLAQILYLNDNDTLRQHMADMQVLNPTITDFFVAEKRDDSWFIILATKEENELTELRGFNLVLSLATTDPTHSFTVEEVKSGERFFRSARALSEFSPDKSVVLVTRQTLSQADKQIAESIRGGMIVLIIVLLFLLLLFFRHARIIDYTVLYKKLKEVDTMKDDFVSMASHELRAPLSAIRGYGEMLKDTHEISSEDGKKFLERIDISAKQLDELIADILDVARLQQGRLEFDNKVMDPSSVINTATESMRFRAEEKKLTIKLQLRGGLAISVDGKRLQQIIINLISNAIKYTKEGSITVKTSVDGNLFVLRVSDTGLGMSSQVQSSLFGKFYRSDSQDVRDQKGAGLGLWITKQIIEEMKGTIQVESIEGVGSHFIVRFPIAQKVDLKPSR